MPTSLISPNFDLINIGRESSILFQNAFENGTGFNINISGLFEDDWEMHYAHGDLFSRVGLSDSNYFLLSGEVDWTNLVMPIPLSARIERIELRANAVVDMHSNLENSLNFAANHTSGYVTVYTKLSVNAPLSLFTPTTIEDFEGYAVDNQMDLTNSFLVQTSVVDTTILLRKIWEFDINALTWGDLVDNFTNIDIRVDAPQAVANKIEIIENHSTGFVNSQIEISTSMWEMRVQWYEGHTWYILHEEIEYFSDVEEIQAVIELEINLDPIIELYNIIFGTEFDWEEHPRPPITSLRDIRSDGIGPDEYPENIVPFPPVLTGDYPGIYAVEPGKINDTVYTSLDPVETEDIKIPDPMIRTFLHGDVDE